MAREKLTSAQKATQQMLRRTLVLLVVCGIVAFIVLGIHLYTIQIRDHDKYESLAIEQQLRETTINASRGTIYDTNMKILAMSATVETVFISPAELLIYKEDGDFVARGLSDILGVSYEKIMKMWSDTGSWYKTVALKLEQETADKVRAFKNDNSLKCVHLEIDTKRYYPYSTLASHIIGFVGTENYGLDGVEAKYNKYLSGVNGRIVRASTATGTDMLYTQFEDYIDAREGGNPVLTIDANVQYYLEKHVSQAIEDYAILSGGMGIVMNIKTGAILGMVTLNNYDPNNYLDVSDEVKQTLSGITDPEKYGELLAEAQTSQWRNRVISDTYEPGSTFKTLTLAIALEEGLISLDDHFYCGGTVNVPGRDTPIHCWAHGGHGDQTLAEAVQHSCNVAFVNIGLRIGAEKFYEYMEALGLFEKTGIDLYGESGSLWWDDDVFISDNLSQLAVASFGQTFNITPLQLITAISGVANGGSLMKPYVVSKVLDGDGNVIMENKPTTVRQVVSKATSRIVCEILEGVVDGGASTGRNAYVAGYRIGGKTATSEKVGQTSDEYIVSFIGIAPADDPEVAVLVLLDNPDPASGIYVSGGIMAAPAVGRIFADILPYLGVEPVYSDDEKLVMNVTVPSLKGLTIAEAAAEIEKAGLKLGDVVGGGGVITDQLPMSNVTVISGTEVILYAGDARPTVNVTVPNLYGYTYSEARDALKAAGLYIRTSGVSASETSDTIIVTGQSVARWTETEYGSVIEVTLFESDISIMETRGG